MKSLNEIKEQNKFKVGQRVITDEGRVGCIVMHTGTLVQIQGVGYLYTVHESNVKACE